MSSKTKALLWVALVFVIGVAFGSAVTLKLNRPQLAAPALTRPGDWAQRPTQASRRPGGRQALVRMLRRLELDQQQEQKVRDILEDARRSEQQLARQSAMRSRRLRRETLELIRDVLTPEQSRRLSAFFRQLRREQREP